LLNEGRERAEGIIEQERQAYCSSKTAPSDKRPVGRPKTKPKILKGDPSARIRQLREFAGLSQDAVAKLAGVHRETVLNLERGHNVPHPSHCAAIRKVLAEALANALWPE
jgi:DNA-binding XRE family transcriptional regulator